MEKKGKPDFMFIMKTLLFSYLLTALLLAVLAFLLFRTDMGKKGVEIGIIIIYIAATIFGGFLAGKRITSRKFLWGLCMGALYFVVLSLVSLLVNRGITNPGSSFFTTMVLCLGGGMFGGMIS